jgi:hypothetical protein
MRPRARAVMPTGVAGDIIGVPTRTAGVAEDVHNPGNGYGGAAMARNDFHVALGNALDLAMPPEVPQECDLEAVVDQCIALLERAGWRFSRTRPVPTPSATHPPRPT